MKKTPSPLIIRPGDIRKLRPDSGEGITRNLSQKNHHKALQYIASAAKRLGGVFTTIFSRDKNSGYKSNSDQFHPNTRHLQARDISYSSSSPAGGRGSRKSSRSIRSEYDLYPEVDSAQFEYGLGFEEVCKATGNFSPANIIGEGGFGTVYRGKLKNGCLVAVKRAKRESYDQRLSAEFKSEILALSQIEHRNLVRFYGYLEHIDERLIVVEYVSNGSLREHLDGIHGNGLEMAERLDVAIDVAHAITYLHSYTDPPIIHRDIKATNILISENLRAKVADFGFARIAVEDPCATHISTQIKGTAGYLDPEYLKTYQLSEKSDVYSFGVLLVEIVTGRHPIEPKKVVGERITVRWVLRRLKEGEVVVAMDPRIRRSAASIQAVEKVLKLARQCLSPSRLSRPSMKKCAENLWEIRKEFKESSLPKNSANTSFCSANAIERNRRKGLHSAFGIHESDSLMFVST